MLSAGHARKHLTRHVARFREEGIDAEPVIFGDRRQPEAVLLPHATFEFLLELAEDLVIAERVAERYQSDSGARTTLAEVADELSIDLDESGGATSGSGYSMPRSITCGPSRNSIATWSWRR